MIYGRFRDGHPRVSLKLPGRMGPIEIEFIVDTGFEGDLTLSRELLNQLSAAPSGYISQSLAGGRIERFETQQMEIEWGDETRLTEVLVVGGEPLIGTELLYDMLLQIEIAQGGEVSIIPL